MKKMFTWVPWFTELAEKIAGANREFLKKRAAEVEWGAESSFSSDDPIEPLSLGALLARYSKGTPRKATFLSVGRAFDLQNRLLAEDSDSWDLPDNWHLTAHLKPQEPDLNRAWTIFRQAVGGSVEPSAFSEALKINGIALKSLSRMLFLANPSAFLPLSDQTTDQTILGLTSLPPAMPWSEYSSTVAQVQASFPGCELWEIELFARLQRSKLAGGEGLTVRPDRRWIVSSSYTGADDCDYWDDKFRPNNLVKTSWDGNEQKYPVTKPERGDIVLVRSGRTAGHGIGLVLVNDYADGWTEDGAIHVLWLNKSEAKLTSATGITQQTRRIGFDEAKPNEVDLFRGTACYRPTLDLLDRLGRQPGTGPRTPPTSERDPTPERGPTEPASPPPQPSGPRNIILYGPPGTGKTYATTGRALAIIGGLDPPKPEDELSPEDQEHFASLRFRLPAKSNAAAEGQIAMVTFHQNYAYEDFVEGIRPRLDEPGDRAHDAEAPGVSPAAPAELGYELRPGIFRRICQAAESERQAADDEGRKPKRFVLIIDEINRGNIPKIFGELITLIEDSRRLGEDDATTVTLPYSGDEFGVPNNLYLIGTMNTADRSIQQLDTALRRRFTFVEMMPDPDHELILEAVDGVNCREMLRAMNERIAVLMDREHQIGHTYLFNVRDLADLADRFQNRIFPLLQEYFYEDWKKIGAVLGGNAFVRERKIGEGHTKKLVQLDLVDESRSIYERLPLNKQAWKDASQYRKIYESPGSD